MLRGKCTAVMRLTKVIWFRRHGLRERDRVVRGYTFYLISDKVLQTQASSIAVLLNLNTGPTKVASDISLPHGLCAVCIYATMQI